MDNRNIQEIRKNIFLAAYQAQNAHIASAYSIVEILYTLYNKNIMKYDAQNPSMESRDFFVLGKGHGSLALYAVLSSVGFFSNEVLMSFCQPGSILGGEPCLPDIPGIEATTGSLGHGLSYATGIALGLKLDQKNQKVYVIIGDGECEEGTTWEAAMFASHYKLDNLVVILDDNKLQKMGEVDAIMSIHNWREKFTSFGWHVNEVNGHNVEQLIDCFNEDVLEKPRLVIAHTIKGKGVSIMENVAKWHWKLPNKKELKVFIKELDIQEEELNICNKPM